MRVVRRWLPPLVLAPLGVAAWAVWAGGAQAQVDLPPPPPPPLSTNQSPSGPPPSSSEGKHGGGKGHGRPPAHTTEHHASDSSAGHASAPEPAESPGPDGNLSLRLNPLPLFQARISGDAEYMFAPHHAVIGSPQLTLSAHRGELVAYGFGYSDRTSGFGGEVGYHYWVQPRLEGIFLGPSLVLGATFAGKSFLYYGAAMDVGWQMIVGKGFTFMAGGGLLVIDGTLTGIATHVTPRALLSLGWTF